MIGLGAVFLLIHIKLLYTLCSGLQGGDMNEKKPKADFCIAVDFEKDSSDPARVFRTISGLIESFSGFDRELAKSIHVKIEPVLLLEDVEIGSIKVWLKNCLECIDDEALKNLDWRPQLGKYLVKAKYITIDFLSKKTTITDRKELEDLGENLLELAKETDIIEIPSYTPVPLPRLAENIEKVSCALSHLSPHDTARFLTPFGDASFNLDFSCAPETIEEILTERQITTTPEMILKVKRPDYLGEAKWDFRHDGRNFDAKILDKEWLQEFQERRVDVRPGDALRARVKVVVKYDSANEVIGSQHEILEVFEVIPGPTAEQVSFVP